MSFWFLFFIATLSVHRVTRFIISDNLIADTRTRFLSWLQFPDKPKGKLSMLVRMKIVELFSCFWCMSIWTAGVFVIIYDLWLGLPQPVLWWLALSSATTVIANYVDGTVQVQMMHNEHDH